MDYSSWKNLALYKLSFFLNPNAGFLNDGIHRDMKQDAKDAKDPDGFVFHRENGAKDDE